MSINEGRFAHELAATHHITTRRRLVALGLTHRQVDGLIARRRLISEGNGALRSPAPPTSLEARAALACAMTGGAIAFPTAGKLWDLRRTPHEAIVHIVVPWERRIVAPPGVRVRRCRALPDTDLVRRFDGITVTSPPRTVFDAAARLGAYELLSMIEDALHRKLFTVATLQRLVDRVGHPCRDGSALISEVLRARDPALAPAASEYELRLERALVARGFPSFVRQHPIELAPGRWVHPDLGVPADRFFVEVDHRRWHDGSDESAYDTWRDRQLRLQGHWVERVSDVAIDRDLATTVEDLWIAWQRARRQAVRWSAA